MSRAPPCQVPHPGRRAAKRLALLWECTFLAYVLVRFRWPGLLEAIGGLRTAGIVAWTLVVAAWAALESRFAVRALRANGGAWALGRIRPYVGVFTWLSFVALLVSPTALARSVAGSAFVACVVLSLAHDLGSARRAGTR